MDFFDVNDKLPPMNEELIVQALGGVTTAKYIGYIDGHKVWVFTGPDKAHFEGCSNAHVLGWQYKTANKNT